MDRLLRELAATVGHARTNGEDSLEPIVLAGYRAAYEQIITLADHQNPPARFPRANAHDQARPSPGPSSCAWT